MQFITDAETVGQSVFKIPIVNVSYGFFDWDRFTSDNPYTFEELVDMIVTDKFDITEQVTSGYKFTKKDLQWWKDQGPEAMKQLKPSDDDLTIDEFVNKFSKYMKKHGKPKYWWSRSNAFDPLLLQRCFEDVSTKEAFDELLPFWGVRDVRTYIDTRFDFKVKKNGFCPYDDENEWNKVFVKHNSAHDVAADILRMQKIERTIHC